MNLKNKKKKKGFTLIELVIVLAVLAIIALIAIPNFTKVRNDSLTKSDIRSAEQIKKITLMAIANEDASISTNYTLSFKDDKSLDKVNDGSADLGAGDNFLEMLKDVKKPQVSGKTTFYVAVDATGAVTVSYASGDTAPLVK